MDNLEYRIGKLALAPHDILVVKVGLHLTTETYEVIKRRITSATDHANIIVLDSHIDLSVLTRAEIEARA